MRWSEPLVGPGPVARVYAVRHGESAANAMFAAAERGEAVADPAPWTDPEVPLSAVGRAQADALGDWLAAAGPDGPDLVVCSPYLRTRETWRRMAERSGTDLSAILDERVRDRETGAYELWTPAMLRERAPDEARRRAAAGEWRYRPPGGESLADVALRVRDLLAELGRVAPDRRVLVVAHDAVVLALRYVLDGLGAPRPEPADAVPTGSVSRWDAGGDGVLRLTVLGDTAHLRG